MNELTRLYEYKLETHDDLFNFLFIVCMGLVFSVMPIVASYLFAYHFSLTPPDLHDKQILTTYLFIGGWFAFFMMLFVSAWLPTPERFYFGQNGFHFEANYGSSTPSFYRPANKVCRISFTPETGLRLTDSLGNRFEFSNVKYSLQSEQELKECFPNAFMAQDEMVDDGENSAKVPAKHEIVFARVTCLMSVISLCMTVSEMIQSGQVDILLVFRAFVAVLFFALSWRFCQQTLDKD